MHLYFFLSMLPNQFCRKHLAVVAGNKVESVSSGGKGRSAGTVSWYRWVIEERIGETANPTSQSVHTLESCMCNV